MSIDLKGITFAILLAALGIGLVLIGAAEKLSIAGSGIEVTDMRFRIGLLALGVVLLVGAGVFQLTESRRQQAEEASRTPATLPQASIVSSTSSSAGATASSFFLTLDDKEIASFPACVDGAVRLRILARTVVNLVGQYGHTFASLAKAGCEVQILIVDPASESAHHVYGNNYNLFLRNAQTALSHLAELQRNHGDRIQVRFFPYVPTVSIIAVERREVAESFLQIQLYFIHGAIGRNRPVFRVYRTDPWYDVFREEFDSIWRTFPDADVATLAARL